MARTENGRETTKQRDATLVNDSCQRLPSSAARLTNVTRLLSTTPTHTRHLLPCSTMCGATPLHTRALPLLWRVCSPSRCVLRPVGNISRTQHISFPQASTTFLACAAPTNCWAPCACRFSCRHYTLQAPRWQPSCRQRTTKSNS